MLLAKSCTVSSNVGIQWWSHLIARLRSFRSKQTDIILLDFHLYTILETQGICAVIGMITPRSCNWSISCFTKGLIAIWYFLKIVDNGCCIIMEGDRILSKKGIYASKALGKFAESCAAYVTFAGVHVYVSGYLDQVFLMLMSHTFLSSLTTFNFWQVSRSRIEGLAIS